MQRAFADRVKFHGDPDFYDVPVLNAVFKRAIRLVNVVGKRVLAANEEDDDGEANEFIFEQLAVDND